MSDSMREAISTLEERLIEQEATVRKTKLAINALHEALGDKPPYTDVDSKGPSLKRKGMRADAFYGKPFATAVREVLDMVRKPMRVPEIVETLQSGGYDFGKTKNLEKAVQISLGKNTNTFVRLPNSDAFGLADWYGNVKKTKPDKSSSESQAGSQNGGESLELSETVDNESDNGSN